MKVTWKVEDGFVGNGTHEVIIEDSIFEDMTEEERDAEIEEWVSEEFTSKVSFDITHINGKKV